MEGPFGVDFGDEARSKVNNHTMCSNSLRWVKIQTTTLEESLKIYVTVVGHCRKNQLDAIGEP